jgi:hypothetical protein
MLKIKFFSNQKDYFSQRRRVRRENLKNTLEWSPLRQEPEAPSMNATSRDLLHSSPGGSRGIPCRRD